MAERDGPKTSDNIQDFGITDQKMLLQLALTVLIHQPNLLNKVQERFGFPAELEQQLSKVAQMQSGGQPVDEETSL